MKEPKGGDDNIFVIGLFKPLLFLFIVGQSKKPITKEKSGAFQVPTTN
jgi:hypothetical protein